MKNFICQNCQVSFRRKQAVALFCSRECRAANDRRPEVRARLFWAKVSKAPHPKGCWLWTGRCVGHGHGIVGRSDNCVRSYTVAHRYAWEMELGPIPEGRWLLHHCDTPNCVNTAHLYIGDRADNVRDVQIRETDKRRLGREKVLQIRADLAADQTRGAAKRVANKHAIAEQRVINIKKGRAYWYYT